MNGIESLSVFRGAAIAVVFVIAATGFGLTFFRLSEERCPNGAALSLSFAAGSCLIALAGVAMLSCGIFGAIPCLLTLVMGLLFMGFNYRTAVRLYAGIIKQFLALDPVEKLCIILAAILCAAGLSRASAPPVELDALAYHLPLARQFAVSGSFSPVSSIVYSFMPLAGETLFAFPLALGSTTGAVMLHAAFGLMMMPALLSAGTRLLPENTGARALACLIFATTPLVVWEMGSGYIDLMVCLFLFSAFAMTVTWQAPAPGIIAAAGLAAGCAVACKLSAGPFAVLIAIILAFRSPKRLRSFILFGLAAALPVIPWLVRSYLATGNPVFPFAWELFGGQPWNAAVNAEFLKWHTGYGVKGIVDFLSLPLNLTLGAAGRYGWPVAMPDRELGMAYLFTFPLLFFAGRAVRHREWLWAFVAPGILIWYFSTQQLRFLLPLLPAVCLLASGGIAALAAGMNNSANSAIAVMAVALTGYCLWTQSDYISTALSAASGTTQAKEIYIAENMPSFDAFLALDDLAAAKTGDNAAVGLLLETRAFYSKMRPVWLNPMQQGVIDYGSTTNISELSARLNLLGVSYILINRRTFDRLNEKTNLQKREGIEYSGYFLSFFTLYDNYLGDGPVRRVFSNGTYEIYEISER